MPSTKNYIYSDIDPTRGVMSNQNYCPVGIYNDILSKRGRGFWFMSEPYLMYFWLDYSDCPSILKDGLNFLLNDMPGPTGPTEQQKSSSTVSSRGLSLFVCLSISGKSDLMHIMQSDMSRPYGGRRGGQVNTKPIVCCY